MELFIYNLRNKWNYNLNNLHWSTGTGQTGTCGQQATWQLKPHISQTIPCLIKPTINDVQWLHFVGLENVRTKNWCALCFIGDCDSCWNKLIYFMKITI